MRRYGCTHGCGNIIEYLIDKIIASDLREIASHLYKVGGYPALDTSCAISKNLIMTAITSSPPWKADPLGCHIRIYNKKNPSKWNKTNGYASARLNKSQNRSLPYEQPHGGFGALGKATATWLVTGGGENPCRRHLSWAKIRKKVSKVKPL